jgi:hypothetical protein
LIPITIIFKKNSSLIYRIAWPRTSWPLQWRSVDPKTYFSIFLIFYERQQNPPDFCPSSNIDPPYCTAYYSIIVATSTTGCYTYYNSPSVGSFLLGMKRKFLENSLSLFAKTFFKKVTKMFREKFVFANIVTKSKFLVETCCGNKKISMVPLIN